MCAIAPGQTPAKPAEKPAPKASSKEPEKTKRARTSDDDVNDAMETLRQVAEKAESLVTKGDLDGADKVLLAAVPEAKRTPAQSLVLARALYQNNRKLSYDFAKAAAAGLPDNSDAQLEWAMAQHRAGEYEGALKAYDRASELRPGTAPVFGVAAECALRLGKIDRALELWKLCTQAKMGSQENFETLVCEINHQEDPLGKRRALVKQVTAADELAATELILLDSEWPMDWWVTGPNRGFLENDLALVGKWIMPGGNTQVLEARCVAALAMIERPTKEKISDILRRSRYVLDDEATMPTNPRAMVPMLKYSIRSGALQRDDGRARLGPKVLEFAKKSKDKDVFEAAAFLYLDTGKQDEVDRLGWEIANDPRRASALLASMYKRNELKWESPELQKAIKDFPTNGTIAGLALRLGKDAGQPMLDLLVRALLAEYTHFSVAERAGMVRPHADALRSYWKMLADETAKK